MATTLVDQIGRLQGDELLKATLALEMLTEDGPLLPLLKKLHRQGAGKTAEQVFADGCGQPLAAFDSAWRDWLLPPRAGLAGRLGSAPLLEEKLAPAERQVVDALNEIRHRASVEIPAVDFDRAASDACRKHALYLAKNPDQLARWPDAHEEYSDHPAFDPAGVWAGTHSVIAPGVKDGREALDGWMATFYHRIPLLDPGLVRIGFALESGTAVLDSGSFVVPHKTIWMNASDRLDQWGIAWPPRDATGVPTRFQGELPAPVPGESETKMGYPITLQLQREFLEVRPDITLVLHAGNATAAEVACWISTPTAPTNPQLAPENCWCLIPKATLRPGAEYTVTGTIQFVGQANAGNPFAWSFRCGK